MNSLEPVILKDNSTVAAFGTFRVVIMRSVMGSIGEVISIAETLIICIGMNIVIKDSFEERLSNKTFNSFDNSVSIFNKNVDAD